MGCTRSAGHPTDLEMSGYDVAPSARPRTRCAELIPTIDYPLILGVSALIAAATTPVFALAARRFGLIVQPRSDRWHSRPTPMLGGAAMALAVLSVLGFAVGANQTTVALILCAGLAFALGLVDDFRRLAPATKLGGQAIVGGLLAFGGIGVEIIEFAPVAFVLTVFWVVGIMNAVNLLDNMDGLAAGITAIAAVVLGITAIPTDPVAATVAFVTAGAALGFLPHNFSPARVFMGDAGSQLLGLLLAAVALLHTASAASGVGLAVLAPILVLAVPIFDTALVTLSRRLAGRPIGAGGRDHTSHRLAAIGLSDRGAVFLLYAVAAALAFAGILAQNISFLLPPLIVLATIGLILFGVFLTEVHVYEADSTDRQPSGRSAFVARAFGTYGRFGAEVGMDVVLLTTAYYLAFVLRFEGDQAIWLYLFGSSVPIMVGAQLAVLILSGTYRTLWRYLTVSDAVLVGRAVALGTVAGAVGLVLAFRFEGYSRAVLVLDALLAFSLLIGARAFLLWLRHWSSSQPLSDERRVLIVGANDTGELALRLLGRIRGSRHRAVGFLDDDPAKRYRRVGGVPIVGASGDLPGVIERLRPDLVLFARDEHDDIRLRQTCDEHGVPWRIFRVQV